MAQMFAVRSRVLVLVLVAAGVVGSVAFYRAHSPTAASGPAWAAPASDPPQQGSLSRADVATLASYDHALEAVAEHVKPAVVQITVTARATGQDNEPMQQFFGQFFGQMPHPQPRVEHGIGSGVIISPNGYIVTNNHVVEGATNIAVTLSNRDYYSGKVVGTDPLTDLAVVKINATNLPTLAWGDSSQIKVGESVLAVGNPFGLFTFSVTHGIVSGVGRPSLSENRRVLGDMIQTDAAINPGNSGGPLVDSEGNVIGINTAIFTRSGTFAGVGFAIPSGIARKVASDLIKNGKVEHGFLGIMIEPVTPEELHFFGLNKAEGALVSEVQSGEPGSKAGIKQGDVIVTLNGQTVRDSSQLQEMTSLSPPGTPVTLGVIRDGKRITLHATLGSAPNESQNTTTAHHANTKGFHLGVNVEDLTSQIRGQLNAPDDLKGALVASVEPGGPADNSGLAPGMVIEQVNHEPVTTADQLADILAKLPPDQPVLLLVWYHGGAQYFVVHPNVSVH